MKFTASEKDIVERLAHAFEGREVLAPHTARNHSNYFLVNAGNHRAAHTVSELINEALARDGQPPAVFATQFAGGAVSTTSSTKTWVAVELPAGIENAVLDTIENVSPHQMHALLSRAKPLGPHR